MEKAFAVSTAEADRFIPKGIAKLDEQAFLDFAATHGRFYDRTPELENDASLKQIIPYVIATHAGKILVYQRTQKQTDQRLHAKFSFGFGGHINPPDATDSQNPVLTARARELDEEISFGSTPRFKFLGVINIQKNHVDTFHIGPTYIAELDSDAFRINEVGYFASTAWKTPEEIAEIFPSLESWSKELFSWLYPQLAPQSV
jgi:predicted NUDIX family phosphoesterase